MKSCTKKKILPLLNKYLALFTLIATLLLTLAQSNCYAESLYESNCKFSGDNSLGIPNYTPLSITGTECTTECSRQCGLLFGVLEKNNKNENSTDTSTIRKEKADEIITFNRDKITDCMNQCIRGRDYSTKIRSYDAAKGEFYESETISTLPWGCGNNNQPDYVDIHLNPCESVEVKANNLDLELDILGENIYGEYYNRGRKNLFLLPNDEGGWFNINKVNSSSKNYDWHDTGIDVANGDFLSIEYKGRFYGNMSGTDTYQFNHAAKERYNLYIKIGNEKEILLDGHKLVNSDINKSLVLDPVNPDKMDEEDPQPPQYETKMVTVKVAGLQGVVSTDAIPSSYLKDLSYNEKNCNGKAKNGTAYNSCYNDTSFPSFTFSGILENYTSTNTVAGELKTAKVPSRLYIRYDGNPIDKSKPTYGGFIVSISHKSEPKNFNEVLKNCQINEYGEIMGNCQSAKSDITTNAQNNLAFLISRAGTQNNEFTDNSTQFFRITMDPWYSQTPPLTPPIGGFSVEIVKNTSNNTNIACKTIKKIRTKLYGCAQSGEKSDNINNTCSIEKEDPCPCRTEKFSDTSAPTSGIVYSLYTYLRKALSPYITAMVIFYTMFISLSFLVGLRNINHQELLYFIFKVGLVLTLISDSSWQFMYKYCFAIFIDGIDQMIDKFDYQHPMIIGQQVINRCLCGGPKIIADIGGIWGQIFSDNIMVKLSALLWFGIIGNASFIVVVFAMFYGAVIFCFVAIKVLFIYLISLVLIGMMLSIAPLMFPFIMFGYTKSIFDNWLKQIIVSFLHPVITTVSFMLFKNMFLLVLQALTDFSICKACLIDAPFFIPLCLKTWFPVKYAHFSQFSLTNSFPIAGISLLIIGQAAHNFTSLTSNTLTRIISFFTTTAGNSLRSATSDMISTTHTASSPFVGLLGMRDQDIKQAEDRRDKKQRDKK